MERPGKPRATLVSACVQQVIRDHFARPSTHASTTSARMERHQRQMATSVSVFVSRAIQVSSVRHIMPVPQIRVRMEPRRRQSIMSARVCVRLATRDLSVRTLTLALTILALMAELARRRQRCRPDLSAFVHSSIRERPVRLLSTRARIIHAKMPGRAVLLAAERLIHALARQATRESTVRYVTTTCWLN